jgi:ketosteroid isomerase-like protein
MEIRRILNRHWAASAAEDLEAAHDIYLDDAICDYPESGERIRGRRHI